MVAVKKRTNVEAIRAAGAARVEASRRAVLEACRRLGGVRELTPAVLAEATGLGPDTCRVRRDELAKAGVIARTWRDMSSRAPGRELGGSVKDRPVVQARIAKVREAKRRFDGGPIPPHVLVQILPF